jgi:uncharacterized protein YfaS (alpha-2-macroglobulin family)
MSRFLPAVVIRDAGRRAPIHLPPEVAAKLPQIYSQGLARLSKFHHADGGWGWWEHDASNDGMTAYVVHGLLIARHCGLRVEGAVIEGGCSYLRHRLREGKLTGVLEARALFALSVAGRIESRDLAVAARRFVERKAPADERTWLALACRQLGLPREADVLYRGLRDWKPNEAESAALQLQLRVAFAAPLADCQSSADALLRFRVNDRWPTTQATAAAILALADFASYAQSTEPAKAVAIKVAGREVAAVRDAELLKKLIYRLAVPVKALNSERRLELASEGDTPLLYSVVVRGIERLDQIEPSGSAIKITRRRESLDGKPLDRPLKVGEVFAVRLTIDLEQKQEFVLIEDRRPSGCEFADEQTVRNVHGVWAASEFRDDRVCLSFTYLERGKHEIVYYLRAETPGTTHILPGSAFPMYAEHLRGETGSDKLEIVEK